MFDTAHENNHYLKSQRLLALAEVAKVTSQVLLNPAARLSKTELDNAEDAYTSAIQEINYIFKYPA